VTRPWWCHIRPSVLRYHDDGESEIAVISRHDAEPAFPPTMIASKIPNTVAITRRGLVTERS
jgi:hypothetical protein